MLIQLSQLIRVPLTHSLGWAETFNILLLMYSTWINLEKPTDIWGYFWTFLDYNHIHIGMIFHIYNHINQSRLIYRPVCPLQTPDPSGRGAVKTGPGDLQAPSPCTRAFKSHPPPNTRLSCSGHKTPGKDAHCPRRQRDRKRSREERDAEGPTAKSTAWPTFLSLIWGSWTESHLAEKAQRERGKARAQGASTKTKIITRHTGKVWAADIFCPVK